MPYSAAKAPALTELQTTKLELQVAKETILQLQYNLAQCQATVADQEVRLAAPILAQTQTTLKAAKELNRQWCGIEINPEYVKIAEARLSQDVLQLETCAMRPNNKLRDAAT